MARVKSTLRKVDFKSDCWERVRATVEARIAELHHDNESLLLDDVKTGSVRGRIAELRKLLALEGQPAEVQRTGDVFRHGPSAAPGASLELHPMGDGADDAYPD